MSSTIHRTPKSSGRQSLFFNDLASPDTGLRSGSSKFTTPGQSAAVSALRRENFATSDVPPPPLFTLEDRSDYSPDFGIGNYPVVSPELNSNPKNPAETPSKLYSTTFNKSPELNSNPSSSSYALTGNRNHQLQSNQSPAGSLSWWSPGGRSEGGGDDKGKGSSSPVGGVVHYQRGLITLPPPGEVARPEIQRNSLPVGNLNEEEWVTVYGFSAADTNLVLREFEKCGVILKHVLGPRDANWVHILYQNRVDAEKALNKNGMQINGALIIGVKPIDAMQRKALSDRSNNQGFMPLPPPTTARSLEPMGFKPSARFNQVQNGGGDASQSGGTIAAPAKSVVSKIVDLMFGV